MTIKLKDNYIKNDTHWFCKTCDGEIYSGKKKYIKMCSCLDKKEQFSIYEDYLSNFYTINPSKYGSKYICKKCNHLISNTREQHAFYCLGLGTRRSSECFNSKSELFSKYCDMGCGQESKFFYKSGKSYCCNLGAKCPVKVSIDRQKKLGKNPLAGKIHPMLGVTSPNKGKTKETSEIVAKQALSIKNTIKLNGHNWTGKKHSAETKLKFSEGMKERYASGWEPVCGRAKKYKHSSPIAGNITVDGTWELSFAQMLDKVNIPWNRNRKRFDYIKPNNEESTYQPDFFVPSWNTYIEVKGYQTDLDDCKWKQFNEPLLIVKKSHIYTIKKWLKNNENIDSNLFFDLIKESTKENNL